MNYEDVGMATKPEKVCTCPFCGALPIVKPYPNNTGASVKCPTEDCATWGMTFDLEDWNKRAKQPISKYLFDIEIFFAGANFHKTTAFRCKECKHTAEDWGDIEHTENCAIGKYLNDTP